MSTRADHIVVEEIAYPAITDEQIAQLNTFLNVMLAESFPEDEPTALEATAIDCRTIPSFIVARNFFVRDGSGAVIARLQTFWAREETNQHVLDVTIDVHPEHRRRGIGTTLLRTAVDVADADGKRLLVMRTVDRVPAGEAFEARIGADRAMVGHTNRLAIADVDRAMVERWVAEGPARAPGYSLVRIDGRVPDELADRYVALMAVMNTAPREDLDMEDWHLTVEQLRAQEDGWFASEGQRRCIVARHDATGDLVGFTEMWRWPLQQPKTVRQWGTGVFPEHRGHALGKWLKAANIARLLEEWPDTVDIRTHNADSNDPMLGINHALGFKPFTEDLHWQISVEKARAYVSR